MEGFSLYWGDTHANVHHKHLPDLGPALAFARDMLDFWPMAYYPMYMAPVKGFVVEDWRPADEIKADWKVICDFAAANNSPGEMVVFPGYEWHGDGTWGDHNVSFLNDHPPLFVVETLPELYDAIRRSGLQAFALPHHTAYMPGVRSKNWDVHDEAISPLAEIYSVHGCSETDEEWIGLRRNRNMGPGVSGGTIVDGLDRGLKVGIICSNDSHDSLPAVWGFGTMGLWAKDLTRESIWEAMAARRAYGVTGDRIELTFTAAGAAMGGETACKGPVRCQARVSCTDALDRIELLRNNRVIATVNHNGAWEVPTGDATLRCKLRVEAGWNLTPKIAPDLPPRHWSGEIALTGGSIVSVERCWRTVGQRVGAPGGRRCEFGFTTVQDGPENSGAHTETTVFEIQGRPTDRIHLQLEGKTIDMTVAEAMAASRMIHFIDDNRQAVCRQYGLEPNEIPRNDRLYYMGPKAKIHRAIPQQGLVSELDFTDENPPAGTNHYRLRVLQRNMQMAWSSPVWVQNGA